MLRRLLIAAAVILSLGVLGFGWVVLSFSGCDYRLVYDRPSPSGRYVAELYGVDCGMGSYFDMVMLRDISAVGLPRLDGRPAGEVITENFDTMDSANAIYWDGETTLVFEHASANGPRLERSEWGGVRVDVRRRQHRP